MMIKMAITKLKRILLRIREEKEATSLIRITISKRILKGRLRDLLMLSSNKLIMEFKRREAKTSLTRKKVKHLLNSNKKNKHNSSLPKKSWLNL